MNRIKILMLFVLLISGSAVYGQTHIYERYATHSNLEVAYIEGFALDSTTRVNVTILRAKNDRAWRWLLKDILIIRGSHVRRQLRRDNCIIGIRLFNSQDFRLPLSKDMSKNCMVGIMWNTQTIVVYHLKSEKDYYLISRGLLKKIER